MTIDPVEPLAMLLPRSVMPLFLAVNWLILPLLLATGSQAGACLAIPALWVVTIGSVAGGWRRIARMDPAAPLQAISSFLWALVTAAAAVALLVATLFLAVFARYGIPPCGPIGGR